jgi:S1-C subfamily serine protease
MDVDRTFTLGGLQQWLAKYPQSRITYLALEDRLIELTTQYSQSPPIHGFDFCEGVLVLAVREGGTASLTGIRPMDEIFEVEGQPVFSFEDIQNLVKKTIRETTKVGLSMKLHRLTDGKYATLSMEVMDFRVGMGMVCLWAGVGVRSTSGAAMMAGVRANSAVVKINGAAVMSSRQAENILGTLRAGDVVAFEFQPDLTQVQSGSYTSPNKVAVIQIAGCDMPMTAVTELAKLRSSHSKMRQAFSYVLGTCVGVRVVGLGMFVAQVDAKGSAAKAGIKKGDIITRVNGRALESYPDFLEALAYTDVDGMAKFHLLSRGRPLVRWLRVQDAGSNSLIASSSNIVPDAKQKLQDSKAVCAGECKGRHPAVRDCGWCSQVCSMMLVMVLMLLYAVPYTASHPMHFYVYVSACASFASFQVVLGLWCIIVCLLVRRLCL